MKTVTLAQFKTFNPCWLEYEDGENRLNEIGNRKGKWTALDVLNLDEVNYKDRLWAVLREEFIPAQIIHEFACRCVEHAWNSFQTVAWCSVGAATFDAVRDAERKWQVEELKKMLQEDSYERY